MTAAQPPRAPRKPRHRRTAPEAAISGTAPEAAISGTAPEAAISGTAPAGFRAGVRLGVDVGSVRIGTARCDPDGLLATPLETVARGADGADGLTRIAVLVAECGAIEVVIGLPRSLSGGEGPAARAVRKYAGAIARRVAPVPVRLVDERLSTVTAHRSLYEAGVSTRRHRPIVDQQAAIIILQSALDAERTSGRPPGVLVDPDPAPEIPSREGRTEADAADE